jgi:hypothetical protein
MATRNYTATDLDRTPDDLRQEAVAVTLALIYITLAQAAKILPPGRNGRPVHIATILRWITDGTMSPTGERVRLQAVRMGSRWLTTREWLDDYARRLTPTFDATEPPVRTSTARTREAARAARELDRLGI